MTFGTHPSEGLTFTEVNAKIQDPQWKLNPLRIFTADELKRLDKSLYGFTHFNKEDLINGGMGRHALAPVAIVFQILWKHPDLKSVRPESMESLDNNIFYLALKYFHAFVKEEISFKENKNGNNDSFFLLLEQYKKLLISK